MRQTAQKSEIPNENNGQTASKQDDSCRKPVSRILVGIYLLNLQRDFRGGLVYLSRHGMAIRQNCLLWISDNRRRSRRPSVPALEFIFVYECSTSGAPWKSHFGRTSDGLLSASRLAHEPLIREAMPHSCGIALRANWLSRFGQLLQIGILDIPGMDLGLREVRTADQLKMEFTGRLHAVDFKLLKRALHPRDRFRRDPSKLLCPGASHRRAARHSRRKYGYPYARRCRQAGIPLDLAGLGLEILFRVFGIDAALDRVTVQPDVSLKQLDAPPTQCGSAP